MHAILQHVFKIQSGEGQRVILFALLGALMSGGLTIGMSAVDAIFLTNAGPEQLPLIYLLTPVMMLVYIPIFSYLLAKVGIDRLFDITISVLVLGGIALYVLLSGAHVEQSLLLLLIVKLYVNLWLYALYTLYWNFTDSYFDILDAKRLFSFFSGGSAFGAMMGGALTATLINYIDVHYLFLVWSGVTLCGVPVLLLIRRIATQIDIEETLDESAPGFLEQMVKLWDTFRTSRYVILLALITFFTLSITLICEYQYMSIFSSWANQTAADKLAQGGAAVPMAADTLNTYSSRELASLFGRLNAYANAFNLIINLFLFNRLVMWLGVRNMALIQPLAYVITFTYLLLSYNLPAAVVGFFAYQGLMFAIDQNNQNFLFNALPTEGKKQMRTFIECICEPVSVAFAGLFLILFARDVGTIPIQTWITQWLGAEQGRTIIEALHLGNMTATGISAWALGGAVVALLLTFVLRIDYVQAMVLNLKRGWLDFSRSGAKLSMEVTSHDVGLLTRIAERGDATHVLPAIRLLIAHNHTLALRSLLGFWKRASEEERALAQPLLGELLGEEDVDIVRPVMEWLEAEEITLDPSLIEELGSRNLIQAETIQPLINAQDPATRAAASVALWSSWKIDHGVDSFQAIRSLLRGAETERIVAIRALGRTNRERYAHSLASYLLDRAPAVRRETLQAMLHLVSRESVRLTPDIVQAIEQGDTPMRVLGMDILARIGDSGCVLPLLSASRTFTPYERRKAERVITQIGLQSVPATVSVLQDRHLPHKSRSIAARALARLSFPQFEALEPDVIDAELQRAYFFVTCQAGLQDLTRAGPGLSLLRRFYQDMQDITVDFVLEMMTISGRLPSYELLSASLRSPNPKERANAIETIEQGCTGHLFQLLFPLIAEREMQNKLRMAKTRYAYTPPSIDNIIEQGLTSSMPVECSSAVQAVYETQQNQADTLLRDMLLTTTDKQVRQTILQLLDKKAGTVNVTEIEKLNCLANTPFFASFGIEELAICSRNVQEQHYDPGTLVYQVGEAAAELFVIMEGEVELNMSGTRWTRLSGESIGEDAVMGMPRRSVEAISKGAHLLRISRTAILETARTYPRVAIGLLAKKWM